MYKYKYTQCTSIYAKGLFFLKFELEGIDCGAIFVSKSRLFQRLAPRYAKDFWPLPVLNMGIVRSVLEFLNSLGCTLDNLTKRSLRYRCARELRDL